MCEGTTTSSEDSTAFVAAYRQHIINNYVIYSTTFGI